FFFETLGPPDAPADVPESARESTRPRWRLVSRDSSWGWFDPRLHPGASTHPAASPAAAEPEPGDPGDEHGAQVLERWAVPMRYGSENVTARGVLVREPMLGTWAPGAVEAPAGVTVNMLPGARPALAMTRTTARSVSVLDDQGTPILRMDSAGVAVDPLSDAARSTSGATLTAGALSTSGSVPGAAGHELVVTGPGSFHAWLDERVQPARRAPVDPSRVAAEGWSIPVVVDGREQAIRGEWRWQPAAEGVVSGSTPDDHPGTRWGVPAGLLGSALLGAIGLRVLGRRGRERMTRPGVGAEGLGARGRGSAAG
ncbi:MAG: hypothetical protein ACRDPJ_19605, partial [Nocardioidaceae bacterium]